VILGAGLLVLVGLGLFIAGLATGTTALYWTTVVVCALAAVLLVLSRRGVSAAGPEQRRPAGVRATADVPRSPATPPAQRAPAEPVPAGDGVAAPPPSVPATEAAGEPPVEDVEVTDLLLIVDLKDEVFVVDEHPRYHLADCTRLAGQTPIPLPLDEARADGFTPCGTCTPDRTLADLERARRRS